MRRSSTSMATLAALAVPAALLALSSVTACRGSTAETGDAAPADAPATDAPPTTSDGGLALSHAISIIVEPNGNHGNELVDAIAAATHSVYVTMYEMSDDGTIDAIAGRASAGLDVQVILDGSSSNRSFNADAYNRLRTAGADVVWSSSAFTYTHEKSIVLDGATAWIMTMNANSSSPSSNREYLAIDTSSDDVAEATAIFHADHAMTAISPTGDLVVANANARAKLVALVNSATTTLDVEGEEFSDATGNGVVPAVARAAQRGVQVHVVIASSDPPQSAIDLVKNSGGQVVITGPASGDGKPSNPYIHAKAIVVDCAGSSCARGYIGSENFSTGSLSYNRELGVLFDTPSELAKVKTTIDGDFSRGTAQ